MPGARRLQAGSGFQECLAPGREARGRTAQIGVASGRAAAMAANTPPDGDGSGAPSPVPGGGRLTSERHESQRA